MIDEDYQHKNIKRLTDHLLKKIDEINDILKEMKNKSNNANKYIKELIGGGFDIRYNNIQHQFDNSECGVYSINFILRLVEGEDFDSIINNVIKDEEMNKYRNIYFRGM